MAKSKRRFIEYMFEFVSPVPWASTNEFERDLAIFFSNYGAEAEVSSLLEGYNGRKIITLTRKETIDPKGLMGDSQSTQVKDAFKKVEKQIPTGKKVKK